MLKLRSVALHNYCQHSHLEMNFFDGMNIIVGPNGCGKSNMMDGVRFALTGQTGLDGGRSTLLKSNTEQGYSRVTFDLDGQDLVVERSLHSASATLDYGDTHICGSKKVDAEIASLVGVPLGVLARFILVEQDKLQACLFDTPATRYTQLRQLLNMDIYDVLTKHLAVETEANADLEQATGRLVDLRASAGEHARTLRSVHNQYYPVRQKVKDLDAIYRQAISNRQVRSAVKDLTERHAQAKSKVDAINPRRVELSSALDALESQYDPTILKDLTEGIRNLQMLLVQGQEAVSLDVQRKTLEGEQSNLNQAIGEADRVLSETNSSMKDGDVARAIARILPNRIDETTRCPVCNGQIDIPTIQAWKDKALSVEQMFVALKLLEGELTRLKGRYQQVVGGLQMVHQRMSTAKPADMEATNKALDEARQIYQQMVQIKQRIDTARSELDMLDRLLGEYTDEMNTSHKRLQDLAGTVVPIGDDEENLIRQVDSLRASVTRTSGMLEMAHQSFKRAMQLYRDAKAKSQNFSGQMAWRHMCQAAGEVVGKILPRRVMDWYLVRILSAANAFLSRFNASFTVSYDESGHEALAHFDHGDYPVMRLSGGQRTVLALAFRLAINAQLTGRIGFCSFDEPDLWLDDANVEAMRDFFCNLSEVDFGYQLILISHRMSLFENHPNVIHLGR